MARDDEKIVHVDQYALTDIDEAAYPHYYGFVNEKGDWYILRETSNGTVRFARSEYSPGGLYGQKWALRTQQLYDYWNSTF